MPGSSVRRDARLNGRTKRNRDKPFVRTFVAIPLPEAVKERLSGLIERLRERDVHARWVKPEQMHLTLRFLGEVPPQDAEHYGEMLALRLRGYGRFPLWPHGVGAFPSRRKPSVVWAGVDGLRSPLFDVQAAAEEEAWAIGLAEEKRAFRPHLTIGRIRDSRQGKRLQGALEGENAFDAGVFLADCVALYASSLTPQGPHYRIVRAVPLGDG